MSFKIKNFNSEALDCTLCADEMALKTNIYYKVTKDKIIGFHEGISYKNYEPAKYALVFVIRGINHNWKQPIAYFLVSNSCTGFELRDIILTTICRLQNIKLKTQNRMKNMLLTKIVKMFYRLNADNALYSDSDPFNTNQCSIVDGNTNINLITNSEVPFPSTPGKL